MLMVRTLPTLDLMLMRQPTARIARTVYDMDLVKTNIALTITMMIPEALVKVEVKVRVSVVIRNALRVKAKAMSPIARRVKEKEKVAAKVKVRVKVRMVEAKEKEKARTRALPMVTLESLVFLIIGENRLLANFMPKYAHFMKRAHASIQIPVTCDTDRCVLSKDAVRVSYAGIDMMKTVVLFLTRLTILEMVIKRKLRTRQASRKKLLLPQPLIIKQPLFGP